MINFDKFKEIELKVGKVTGAERIEKTDKLLKLKVDLGKEIRQIITGIAQFYKPEDLIGKEIVIVANLEPKVLAGNESQGMILTAEGEKPVILIPEEEVPPGAEIR